MKGAPSPHQVNTYCHLEPSTQIKLHKNNKHHQGNIIGFNCHKENLILITIQLTL